MARRITLTIDEFQFAKLHKNIRQGTPMTMAIRHALDLYFVHREKRLKEQRQRERTTLQQRIQELSE